MNDRHEVVQSVISVEVKVNKKVGYSIACAISHH